MALSFPEPTQFVGLVGRSPWTAADANVGSPRLDDPYFATEERVLGDPGGPGGPPHGFSGLGKTAPQRNATQVLPLAVAAWFAVIVNNSRLASTTSGTLASAPFQI
jgi:hypothetical protein